MANSWIQSAIIFYVNVSAAHLPQRRENYLCQKCDGVKVVMSVTQISKVGVGMGVILPHPYTHFDHVSLAP